MKGTNFCDGSVYEKGEKMAYIENFSDRYEWMIYDGGGKQYGTALAERLFKFAVNLLFYLRKLPRNDDASLIKRQLLKSGTSIGANYEEAQGAISRSDFSNKCSIVLKECRETNYWFRLIKASKIDNSQILDDLIQETQEFIAIFTAIQIKTRPRK